MSAEAQPATGARDGLSALVVPLDKPSDSLDAARKSLEDALAGIPAQNRTPPRSAVTKSGQFVLWGDLFKTGDCFALAELSRQSDEDSDASIAFAQWTDGKWELRGLWKIYPVWRPEGWKESHDDYLPETPATQPFELRDLSGDSVPEVVVAGEVGKYFQAHYLLRFSPKTRRLKLVATAMASPEMVDKYVRLSFDSGRRSIWEEWQFNRWKGEDLVPVASWHDEVGYNQNDPTFSEGERTDAAGKSEVIRIGYGKGQEYDADSYELTRDEEPSGRMRVRWKDAKNYPPDAEEIEKAWLFEKITGLPRRLYPAREDARPIRKLEDFATVTVEGNDEAAKLFETGR